MTKFDKEVDRVLKDMKKNPQKDMKKDIYYPKTYTFGDKYGNISKNYDRAEVYLLLIKFPPCKLYKHKDSCTAYYPTDKAQKSEKVTEVNPVLLTCEGTDSYRYMLSWFTYSKETESYYEIEVIINYSTELVKITYRYNDSRKLPKYSGFECFTCDGLIPYMYYGDAGNYMTKFICEVADKTDLNFFGT